MADELKQSDYRQWMFELLELNERLDSIKKEFEKLQKQIHPAENSAEQQAAFETQTNIDILQQKILDEHKNLDNKLNGEF